jgi:hypothetical protein
LFFWGCEGGGGLKSLQTCLSGRQACKLFNGALFGFPVFCPFFVEFLSLLNENGLKSVLFRVFQEIGVRGFLL